MAQLTGFGRLLLQNIVYRQVHGIDVFSPRAEKRILTGAENRRNKWRL